MLTKRPRRFRRRVSRRPGSRRSRSVKALPGQEMVARGLSDMVRGLRVVKTGVTKVSRAIDPDSSGSARDLNRATTEFERVVISAINEFSGKSARALR